MLFTAALQLADPWKVIDVSFRDAAGGKRELRITVGYGPGSRFHCPEAKCREESCPVHDTAERVWRHWDFFQYKAYIHALVPRVACLAHGVRTVPVPWARPGSGFTLLFEAMVVELAKTQTVADVAAQVGEHDTRLWRFIRHYVDEARLYEDYTGVWIGNGVLDRSLEDQSLFGEFLRTPVSEGGTEPPVVGPPHAVVGAAPRLPDRDVAVPVHELLPQRPVRRFDHGVIVGIALARQRSFDVEHVEQLVDPRVVELAAPVRVEHLDVRQREVERGERAQYQARVLCGSDRLRVYALVMPCSRMMLPIRLLDAVTPLLSSAALIFLAP